LRSGHGCKEPRGQESTQGPGSLHNVRRIHLRKKITIRAMSPRRTHKGFAGRLIGEGNVDRKIRRSLGRKFRWSTRSQNSLARISTTMSWCKCSWI